MESFDRAINFILSLKTDQYTSALSSVTKTTDDSMGTVNASLGKVQVSMDAVTASTQATTVSLQDVAQTATQAGAGLTTAAQGTSATSQAMAALDTATKSAGSNLGTVATAATNTAKATESSSTAMKTASESASALGKSAAEAGKATEATAGSFTKAAASIGQTGQSSSTAGSLLRDFGTRVTSLVPGLGGLATIAGGVATGLGGLQIAEKVGGWLLDVGTKAIAGSAALKTINDTVTQAQQAFQQAAGKGIETLATAITQLLGPSLQQMIGWITEGLKWVTAFGDWFQKSGIVTSLASSLFERLGAGFAGVGNQANGTLAFLLNSLGLLSTKLDENGNEVIDWAAVWTKTCKAIEQNIVLLLATVDYFGDQAQKTLNAVNDAVAKAGQATHDALQKAWDALPDFLKSWNTVLQVIGVTAVGTLKKANDAMANTPSAGANQNLQARIDKWQKVVDGLLAGVSHEKDLNDAAAKTTQTVNGLADAYQGLVGKMGFGDALKNWQAFLALQQQIQVSAQAMIGTYQEADKVFTEAGKDGRAALDSITQAMNSLKFSTDAQINDMVSNVKVGWEQQVSLAGTSTQEIMRINQAAWDQIVTIVQTQWATMNAAQRQAIAEAGAEIQKSADTYNQVLTKTTTDTKTATEQQSTLWKECASDINKFMRQAASNITDALWNGDQSFGQVTKTMLEDIGKMFTKTFIDVGLKAVQKFVTEGSSGLSSFMSSFGGLGGLFSGGGGSSAAMAGPGFAAPATGGIGSAVSGALGTVSAVSGIVTGAISAISGVIGNFQMKGLTKVDENIQQGVFLTFYAVHDLYVEFVSYFHDFMNNWRNWSLTYYNSMIGWVAGIVARIDHDLTPALRQLHPDILGIIARLDQSIVPLLRGVGSAGSSVMNFDPTSIVTAFQNALAGLQSSLSQISVGGIDFSPLTDIMTQVRDALTSGALRPNVTITVSTGVTTEQVSREIVYQLQMAGVIR